MALVITTKTTKDELQAEVERLQGIEAKHQELVDQIHNPSEPAHDARLDINLGKMEPNEVQRRGFEVTEAGYVYKFTGSCRSDLGYNVDSLKGRAVFAAQDAFDLAKLGVDQGGNPAWRGWPEFTTDREIIVTVEVR
jgi:hypothetical protein